jgi:hypothetical protein
MKAMTKPCPGYFDREEIQLLRDAELTGTSISQPCARCGKKVAAENKAGQWVPSPHYPPINSGKTGFRKTL